MYAATVDDGSTTKGDPVIGALSLLGAYALDAALGEPPNRFHPVAWLGRLIARGRDWALRGGAAAQFVRGSVIAVAIPALCSVLAWALTSGVSGSRWLLAIVTLLALKPLFAVRALRAAAFAVRDALERGDLAAARVALGSLCSRKADQLDEQELVGATIESIAENASDSFVAPVFFFVLLGLPGAAWYRAVNTLDAMVGYHGRFEWVGKTAARMDDVLNWLPARFTAACLLGAAVLLGANARRGWCVLRRDGGLTESPNAGQPMAAMAGLLGVRLEKAGHYALGDATRPLQAQQITEAWRFVALALGLWLAVSTAALLCLAQFAVLPCSTPWAAGGPFG